jgi:hypothetical protein
VFHASNFFAAMHKGLYKDVSCVRGGFQFPLAVVADSAYPLYPWCMKRFYPRRNQGSPVVQEFDRRVSSARIVVENAFARLKNRWTILKNVSLKHDMAPLVTVACCTLHNFVQSVEGYPLPTRRFDSHAMVVRDADFPPANNRAKQVRENMARYCASLS